MELLSSVSTLYCLQQLRQRSSHPAKAGMQPAEHPRDQQPIPLHLCIVKDLRFYVNSHVLEGGEGRNDRTCQSQNSEMVLPDAYGWLPPFSKPLDKQKLTESYLTADTKSHFLALYSGHLQHSKNQETSRKKFPALMPWKLFFHIFRRESLIQWRSAAAKKTTILFYTWTDLVSGMSFLLT